MKTISSLDFTDPKTFLLSLVLIFIIIFLRYLLLSGAYQSLIFKIFQKSNKERILFVPKNNSKQIKRELKLSSYSAIIFSVMGMLLLVLWQLGFTQIYTDNYEYSLWYIPLSIIIFLLIHDFYYYWLHKWMHESKILRRFHMHHHKSVNTTAFTSFSFHPVESVLQGVIVPIIVIVLPMSLLALSITLILMTISAIINHGGVEIYPLGKKFKFFGKHIIGATHHDHHHRNVKKNYGLYFTFWDRIMKTER